MFIYIGYFIFNFISYLFDMRTIESMCFEISDMATQTEAIHDTISSYVNILSSDEKNLFCFGRGIYSRVDGDYKPTS